MNNYLIVNKNSYFKKKLKNTKRSKFYHITDKKNLSTKKILKIKPKIIFFPHWSWIIDKNFLKNNICVGFHSTPLPYGRGGSPIQNMIIRGHNKTLISAFKIEKSLDTGPIFMQTKLNLKGDGHEIFEKMYRKILTMIVKMTGKLPKPSKQKGKVRYFKRLKKSDGQIKNNYDILKIFNLIRSLDMNNKNYSSAFIGLKNVKVSFLKAKIKKNKISASAIFEKIS
jgi:methionyl-tRNA formyltransferase